MSLRMFRVVVPAYAHVERSVLAADDHAAAVHVAQRCAWQHDLDGSEGTLRVAVRDDATGLDSTFAVSIQLQPVAIALRVP